LTGTGKHGRTVGEKGSSELPSFYCFTCKKAFGCDKAFQNHLFSKKHLQLDLTSNKTKSDDDGIPVITTNEKRTEKDALEPDNLLADSITKTDTKKAGVSIFDDDSDNDSEDDSWEEIAGCPIPVNCCLFCSHESHDMDSNMEHMSAEHSFFIPDAEYCANLEGLLEYLGEKVGEGLVCLWCNDKGKSFYTLESVQQHMQDKGHCKILHEGDTIFEYTDFYDYSSSYPDGADVNADEPFVPDVIHFNDNMQLVLPSGITLGHRSLKIYYKQYLRPSSQLMTRTSKSKQRLLASKFKAIGYGSTSLAEAQQKHRDQMVFKRVRDKYQLRLGMKGNKTKQMHFRAQVLI